MKSCHAEHAHHVVETFRNKISASADQHIGAKHLEELELLIESAISSAVMSALEEAAKKADTLAADLRKFEQHQA
ncbi:hypothetical protein SAMN05421831_10868 [Allopseudospirillum japonicum]|uniref:Uncharacterized protein n=1 Tax=Allopseudospirillum japonicum TaxID=64971 RepID=A0A1H6SUX4_9GAMM|nr:hypothetical protein [Allopseudospirillum japonicum]SEI71561.1 hypothetical protein SAMN05421831_10868 [Allopseudospirillum japonicum]